MMKLSECYKKNGLVGVLDFIQEQINEIYRLFEEEFEEESEEESEEEYEEDYEEYYDDVEVEIPKWIIGLREILSNNYQTFEEYPQTLMNALYHSKLFEYPEIKEWFDELKKESKNEPIDLLWDYPKIFTSYYRCKGHDNFAQGLVVLGDGRFATSSEDGYIKIWNYKKVDWKDFFLELEKEVNAHDGYPVNNLAFNPEKNLLASCGDDYSVRLWDSNTLEKVVEFTGHTDYVSKVIFGDEILLSASKDKRIGVWDINTLQNITFLEGHTAWVTELTVSPDKKSLFSVSVNNQLIEWDLEQLIIKRQVNEGGGVSYLNMPGNIYIEHKNEADHGHSSYPQSIFWASNNKLYSADEEVIEWDIQDWKILKTYAYDINTINSFIITKSFLITFSTNLKIYKLGTGELINEYKNVDGFEVKNAALSLDEQYLISTDKKGYIVIWEWKELLQGEYSVGTGDDMHTFETLYKDNDASTGVAVSGGFVTDIGVWDLQTGKMTDRIERPREYDTGNVRIAKLHNNNKQVLIMYKALIELVSPYHPRKKQRLKLPNDLFEPELVVGTKNGILFGDRCYQPYYYDLKKDVAQVFDKEFSYTGNFSISPDQNYVLALTYPQSFDQDGHPFINPWEPISSPFILIDLEKEVKIRTFWCSALLSVIKIHKKWKKITSKIEALGLTYPTASAWSVDGKLFAAGFNQGHIIIYNMDTKKKVKKIKLRDKAYISFIAWQLDGTLAAKISSANKIIKIDLKSGKVLKEYEIKGYNLFFRGSHQQGRYILWSSNNKEIGIFDALKFEVVCILVTKVIIRSVRIEEDKLLLGGEDGFLYGYNIKGIL